MLEMAYFFLLQICRYLMVHNLSIFGRNRDKSLSQQNVKLRHTNSSIIECLTLNNGYCYKFTSRKTLYILAMS